MTGLVFVDTNVFVYRHDDSVLAKQSRAEQWIAFLVASRTGRLSYQVLQELYRDPHPPAAELRPFRGPPDHTVAVGVAAAADRPWHPGTCMAGAGAPRRLVVGRTHHRRRSGKRIRGSPDRRLAGRPGVRRREGGRPVRVSRQVSRRYPEDVRGPMSRQGAA